MELELEMKTPFDDLRKCQLCKTWIEENTGKRFYICNKLIYYHPICFELMMKKMEMLGYLYS